MGASITGFCAPDLGRNFQGVLEAARISRAVGHEMLLPRETQART
jgi:hypothetical protein